MCGRTGPRLVGFHASLVSAVFLCGRTGPPLVGFHASLVCVVCLCGRTGPPLVGFHASLVCAVFLCDHTTDCEVYSFTISGCGVFNVCTNLGSCRTHEGG